MLFNLIDDYINSATILCKKKHNIFLAPTLRVAPLDRVSDIFSRHARKIIQLYSNWYFLLVYILSRRSFSYVQ